LRALGIPAQDRDWWRIDHHRARRFAQPGDCVCAAGRTRSVVRRAIAASVQLATVATTFIVGGLIPLGRKEHRIRVESVDDVSPLDALKLGIAQAFALIPGTSRSGATIIGGLLFGLSRRAATEFSFLLAIPTLIIATIYQLYKERQLLAMDDIGMFAVGAIAAFVSAFWAVRGLLRYISTHDFTAFAWYRIAFGVVVVATWYWDIVDWSTP
jgi:undecaprenyl-diphosphatase